MKPRISRFGSLAVCALTLGALCWPANAQGGPPPRDDEDTDTMDAPPPPPRGGNGPDETRPMPGGNRPGGNWPGGRNGNGNGNFPMSGPNFGYPFGPQMMQSPAAPLMMIDGEFLYLLRGNELLKISTKTMTVAGTLTLPEPARPSMAPRPMPMQPAPAPNR